MVPKFDLFSLANLYFMISKEKLNVLEKNSYILKLSYSYGDSYG